MKYILVLILIFSSLFAEDEKQKVTIGLGPYIQSQPYKNVDDIVVASPVIFYDNEIVYVRWSRAGLYFYGDKQEDYAWAFSLTVQPRVNGYEAGEVYGMQERESTWEGGLAFSAKTQKAYIEIMALTDVLDRYDSFIVRTEIGYDLKFGKLELYPSMIFIYQSKEFLNYYYGVTKTEELVGAGQEYKPNAGLEIGVQTYIKYPITESFSALVNIRADRISKEATHSPIVYEDFIYSGLASLIYTFYY